MTKNQKIALSVFIGFACTYGIIFLYQRLMRAKADKNTTSYDDALNIIAEKRDSNEGQSYIVITSNTDATTPDGEVISDLTDLQRYEMETGAGDY